MTMAHSVGSRLFIVLDKFALFEVTHKIKWKRGPFAMVSWQRFHLCMLTLKCLWDPKESTKLEVIWCIVSIHLQYPFSFTFSKIPKWLQTLEW